jgi:hypothetical protein
MNQNQLHKLAGVLSVSGGLGIATGILLFSPQVMFGGTILTVAGAIVTLCMLERAHFQAR